MHSTHQRSGARVRTRVQALRKCQHFCDELDCGRLRHARRVCQMPKCRCGIQHHLAVDTPQPLLLSYLVSEPRVEPTPLGMGSRCSRLVWRKRSSWTRASCSMQRPLAPFGRSRLDGSGVRRSSVPMLAVYFFLRRHSSCDPVAQRELRV